MVGAMTEILDGTSLLLDTNVWLDYFIESRSGHHAAFQLIDAAFQREIALLFAVTSSKDIFYTANRAAKYWYRESHDGELTDSAALAAQEIAWGCLNQLRELGTAVDCDLSDVWLACKHRPIHGDYEDDLILAAVQRVGSTMLVTNDEKLLRHCPMAALDVKDALAYVEQIEE